MTYSPVANFESQLLELHHVSIGFSVMLCVSLWWCFNTVFIWLFKPVISDLEYDSMKATLTRIYSSTTSASQLEPVKMKPEQDPLSET